MALRDKATGRFAAIAGMDHGDLPGHEISRHWRGETGLARLICVNLLGVRLGSWLAIRAAADAPPPIWPALPPILAAVLVWQGMGAFRHARDRLDRPEGLTVCAALFAAMLAVAVSTFWQLADIYRHKAAPPEPVHAGSPVPALPRSADGTAVALGGPITLAMYAAFRDLDGAGALRRVTLDSAGGNVFAARGLARLIETRGLDTHVTGRCYSACTLAFIAGARRSAGPGARFGFHGYRHDAAPGPQAPRIAREQARDRRLFLDRGVSAGFVAAIYRTPADRLWRPDRAELVAANVLTPGKE